MLLAGDPCDLPFRRGAASAPSRQGPQARLRRLAPAPVFSAEHPACPGTPEATLQIGRRCRTTLLLSSEPGDRPTAFRPVQRSPFPRPASSGSARRNGPRPRRKGIAWDPRRFGSSAGCEHRHTVRGQADSASTRKTQRRGPGRTHRHAANRFGPGPPPGDSAATCEHHCKTRRNPE